MIDKSSKHEGSAQDAQIGALRGVLEELTPDEIVGFQRCFDECMAQSYHWDLWGAAYIIAGGYSDDAFMDFRSWLISKGEAVYNAAMKNPETLAEAVVDSDTNDDCQFEEFQYYASPVR